MTVNLSLLHCKNLKLNCSNTKRQNDIHGVRRQAPDQNALLTTKKTEELTFRRDPTANFVSAGTENMAISGTANPSANKSSGGVPDKSLPNTFRSHPGKPISRSFLGRIFKVAIHFHPWKFICPFGVQK